MGREDIGIIPATDDSQLAGIADLAGRIWRVCYPDIISSEQIQYMLAQMYAPDTLRAEIRTQKIRFYQLLVGGRMMGFASIGPAGAPGVTKLHKLYVAPESHGRGLGKRLLNHCEAEAARHGSRHLILAVNKRNARAIAFYQRNGLSIIESVVSDIGGGFVMDDFIMAREV